MYGKFFESTFSGSMVGAGTDVFAVWGYIIAHTKKGQVELNPTLLASTLGSTVARMEKVIEYLCSADPKSRSPEHEGRRLVREGQFAYFVPSHAKYRSIKNEDERREYNRAKQAESRSRKKSASKLSTRVKARVNDIYELSAHTEAETETETETETTSSSSARELRVADILNVLAIAGPTAVAWGAMLDGMVVGMGTSGMRAVPLEVLYEAAQELATAGGEVSANRYKVFVWKVRQRRAQAMRVGGENAPRSKGRLSPYEQSIINSKKAFGEIPE